MPPSKVIESPMFELVANHQPKLFVSHLDIMPGIYKLWLSFDAQHEMVNSVKLNDETIIVNLKALDKITAKTSTLSIKLGEEKYFGNLKIKPLKCKSSDIDQPPDTVAYLQVIDTSDKKNDQVFVFNGWTFASSPTLRSLDHAIYDLWLLGCSNT